MAGRVSRQRLGRLSSLGESKKSPSRRKPRLVLDMNFQVDNVRLIMTALVNGPLAGRSPDLQDKHRLVRPGASLHEFPISAGRHKNVVKILAKRVGHGFDK